MTGDERPGVFTVRPPVEHVTILEHLKTVLDERDTHYRAQEEALHRLLAEMDTRHQQRFDAQVKAIEAAFIAQQTATQAALSAADRAVTTAMIAAEKAVAKAEASAEKRFESVNEFRGQLTDQANTFIPRNEAEQRFSALSEKIDLLKDLAATASGRGAGLTAGWGYVVGAVGLVGAVLSIIASR